MKRAITLAGVMLAVLPFLAWAADKAATAPRAEHLRGENQLRDRPGDRPEHQRVAHGDRCQRPHPGVAGRHEQTPLADRRRGRGEVKAEFSTKIQEEQAKKAALAEENSKAEAAFLAKNKSVKGVVTTASGLQYQVLKEGNGPKPRRADRVKVHYVGKLLDGKEFDSSYSSQRAGGLRAERRHPRVDGGASAHEDGRQVSPLDPLETGVRHPRRRQDDRTQRPADLRCGAARNGQRVIFEKARRKRSAAQA